MDKDFVYFNPVKILFGEGKIKEAGEYSRAYGNKALIVTTGNLFKENGLVKKLQEILKKSGVDSVHFPEVDPNPTNVQVDAGALVAKEEGCDFFIGLGGGSAIDAAKGMAIALGHGKPIWNFCMGPDMEPITEKTLPIVAIVTTSGTGSECTQWSVITNPETREKPGIGADYTFARLAIVDPELAATMPPAVTASTGFDALAHAIEAYTAVLSTPITDMACEKSIQLCGRYLRRAVANGQDMEARRGMSYSSMLSGVAISVGVVTLCHGLAHTIGGLAGTTHGQTLAAMTPHTMKLSLKANPEKFRKIAMLLKGEEGTASKYKPEESIREVEKLIKDLELNRPLSKQGLAKVDIEAAADAVIRYMGGSITNDPSCPERADIVEIVKSSF